MWKPDIFILIFPFGISSTASGSHICLNLKPFSNLWPWSERSLLFPTIAYLFYHYLHEFMFVFIIMHFVCCQVYKGFRLFWTGVSIIVSPVILGIFHVFLQAITYSIALSTNLSRNQFLMRKFSDDSLFTISPCYFLLHYVSNAVSLLYYYWHKRYLVWYSRSVYSLENFSALWELAILPFLHLLRFIFYYYK